MTAEHLEPHSMEPRVQSSFSGRRRGRPTLTGTSAIERVLLLLAALHGPRDGACQSVRSRRRLCTAPRPLKLRLLCPVHSRARGRDLCISTWNKTREDRRSAEFLGDGGLDICRRFEARALPSSKTDDGPIGSSNRPLSHGRLEFPDAENGIPFHRFITGCLGFLSFVTNPASSRAPDTFLIRRALQQGSRTSSLCYPPSRSDPPCSTPDTRHPIHIYIGRLP